MARPVLRRHALLLASVFEPPTSSLSSLPSLSSLSLPSVLTPHARPDRPAIIQRFVPLLLHNDRHGCRPFSLNHHRPQLPRRQPTTTTTTTTTITTSPLQLRTMSSATTTTTTVTTADTAAMSAETVLRLFPEIDTTSDALEGHDEEQIRLMDEMCIVTDANDNPIGKASKKICHLMTNINKGLLHRAFSVFLFDSQNRLLLQQRASEKITFPDMWTNTCCSHPLAVAGETGDTLVQSVEGAKRAAQRKLDHELGIPPEQVLIEKYRFLTRIHYLAPSDGKWGEHEIDYILFIKADVDLAPNANEVQDTKYVSPDELKALFANPTLKFTPWFKLICDSLLFGWWKHLDAGLEQFENEDQIRRM